MTVERRKLPVQQLGHLPVDRPLERVVGAERPSLVPSSRAKRLWRWVGAVVATALAVVYSGNANVKLGVAMLTWIKERFSEASTYKGVTAVAGAVGFVVNPEAYEVVVAVVLSIIGFIDFIQDEKRWVKKADHVGKPKP